jgi:molecular chaperone DnaK
VDVPFIAGDGIKTYNLSVALSREKFDELTAHLTKKTIDCCRDALYISSLAGTMTVDEITHLALVGLATRTPRVVEQVTAFFKKTPLRDVDPDTVVALGAARQAGVLEGLLKDILLLDSMGHSLGIEVTGGAIAVILEKNTTIPFRSTHVFATTADQQTHAVLHVLQGESQSVSGNTSLGQMVVDGIPPDAPGKQLVDVTFDIDANHSIQVHTYIHTTGQSRSVLVTGAQPLYENLPEGITSAEIEAMSDATSHPDDPFVLRPKPGDFSG